MPPSAIVAVKIENALGDRCWEQGRVSDGLEGVGARRAQLAVLRCFSRIH